MVRLVVGSILHGVDPLSASLNKTVPSLCVWCWCPVADVALSYKMFTFAMFN